VYRSCPALWNRDDDPAGFRWIDADDGAHNVISYVRYDHENNPIVVAVNFAGVPHEGYRLAFPHAGAWDETLNTDAAIYGGSGVGNLGRIEVARSAHKGFEASAPVRLPPLGAVYFRPAAM
jgi:1,4-alpha-glucan branching enzyme